MKNAMRLLAAMLAAFVMTVPFAGPAQAYPDPTITLKLSIPGNELIGGLDFDFDVSSGGVDCDWAVTYRGATKTGSGTSLSGTFGTPRVDTRTPTTITAVCTYTPTNGSALGSASSEVQAADTASASATVYLLPRTAGGNTGGLPSTGGSQQWILWAGVGLVVLGGGAVLVARRRTH